MTDTLSQPLDPWRLVWGQPYIDSDTLAAAIERDLLCHRHPDYRTRLLVRDAAEAIRSFWGKAKFERWLRASPAYDRIRGILAERFTERGYPHLRRRLVDSIDERQIKQIFTLLGQNIHQRLEVYVAGSIPTLIAGLTARPTEDIDIVNEVPEAIRKQRSVLRKIQTEYGLNIGHVQSHYLPAGWEDRRRYLGDFGGLRVYLVDPYDIFVSKLSSKQKKHQDDLRVLALKLDKDLARERLLTHGRAFLDDPHQRPQIDKNWQFIFQEPLLPVTTGTQKEEASAMNPKRERQRKKSNGGRKNGSAR